MTCIDIAYYRRVVRGTHHVRNSPIVQCARTAGGARPYARRCKSSWRSADCILLQRMTPQMRLLLVWLAVISSLRPAETAGGKKIPAGDQERERNQRLRYTASWAVEITEGGDKAADAVARRHGYRNLGKVTSIVELISSFADSRVLILWQQCCTLLLCLRRAL